MADNVAVCIFSPVEHSELLLPAGDVLASSNSSSKGAPPKGNGIFCSLTVSACKRVSALQHRYVLAIHTDLQCCGSLLKGSSRTLFSICIHRHWC